MKIGELHALITADDKPFVRVLGDADRKAQATATKVKQTFDRLKISAPNISDWGSKLSLGVSLPLGALGVASAKSASQLESLRSALDIAAGSAAEGSKQFARLQEAAKLPGLGLKQLIEGSVNLQSAGFSAELAERNLKAFGNALASVGKGKNELDGINLALTQMATSAKPLQEEINQIRERLPQFQKLMVQAFGTARSEDIQKLGITGKQFVERMLVELEKLPKAAGGSRNTFDNLSDAAEQSMAKVGKSVLRIAVPALERITPKIEEAANAFERLSPEAQNAALGITAVAFAAGPTLSAVANTTIAVSNFTKFAQGASAALTGAGGLAGALSSVNPLVWAGAAAATAGAIAWYEYGRRADEAAAMIQQAANRASGAAPDLIGGGKAYTQLTPEQMKMKGAPGGKFDYDPKNPLKNFSPLNDAEFQAKLAALEAPAFKPPKPPKLPGDGGSAARIISEYEQMQQRLAGVNKEIAYLGNASSKQYKLAVQLAGAEQVKGQLQELLELRLNLFSDGPTGELGQLQALKQYNDLLKQNREVSLAPYDGGNAQAIQDAAAAYESLNRAIEGSRPALNLTNEQRLTVGDLAKEYEKLTSVEKAIVLTRAQSADATIKAANATEYLKNITQGLNADLERMNQSSSVYLNTFRELTMAGIDTTSEAAKRALGAARGIDTRKREQSEQDRVAAQSQRFEERMRGIGDRLGQDFDDIINSLAGGGDRWKNALKNLAGDFFNSLIQEFMLKATGGKYGSIGGLLGGVASSFLSGILGGIGGGGIPNVGGTTTLSFASGGAYPGGLALVGEQGPELINFNRGGHVYPAHETAAMLSQQPVIVNNHFHITAPGGTIAPRTQQQIATQAAMAAQNALKRNT